MGQQLEPIVELNLLLENVYAEDRDLIYTVIRSATLANICTKCGVDYWKNYDDILIKVGQILKTPGCPFEC